MKDDDEGGDESGGEGSDEGVMKVWWRCNEGMMKVWWTCDEGVMKVWWRCDEGVIKVVVKVVMKLILSCLRGFASWQTEERTLVILLLQLQSFHLDFVVQHLNTVLSGFRNVYNIPILG